MMPNKPFFPHLDGLRFFAFLTVLVSHIAVFVFPGKLQFLAQGDLGVSFFFVLSGFLITYLLLCEKDAHGKVHLSFFYLRRILRIWPVYYITLIVGIFVALLPITVTLFPVSFHSSDLPWYTGFISNFYFILSSDHNTILAVLWSISVEEQFYFFWPLLFSRLQKKLIPWFLLSIIFIGTYFRFVNAESYGNVEYSTLSVMSDLAMGALIGYCMYRFRDIQNYTSKLFSSKSRVFTLYALLVGMIVAKVYMASRYPVLAWYVAIEPVMFSMLFAGVIVEQNYSVYSLFKVGKSGLFTYLGKISYGLYAYHMIAMFLVWYLVRDGSGIQRILITIGTVIVTFLFAHFSYQYIEKRILKLKDTKFQIPGKVVS